MAKFCTKCGKPLKEGQVCDCSKEQIEELEEVVESNGFFNDLINVFIRVFTKPFSAIKEFSDKEGLGFAFTLIGISSIFVGLFFYFGFGSTLKSITNSMNSMSSLFGSGLSSADMLNSPDIPFLPMFITGIVMTFATACIHALWSKLFIGIVFKGKGTLKEYLKVNAIATVYPTMINVVAILCCFIHYKLAFFIFMLGLVLYFVSVAHGYLNILKSKEEYFGYSFAISMLLTIISIVIIAFIMITIFSAMFVASSYAAYNSIY